MDNHVITASFELQVSLILLFSLAGYLLSSRINQSAVVGVILIGIIIGPSGFGIIEYTDAVKMLAHLGAIMLLFAVGLEFKIRDVYKLQYLFIAALGLILPWVAGYLLGGAFGYGFRESMFIGVSMTATSIAITAKVLEEMKKIQTPVARAIIGAAVIDDVLGLLALSTATQVAGGEEFSIVPLLITSLKAVVFIVAGVLSSPQIKKLFLKLDKRAFARKYPEFLFITAVMFCFLYSSIADLLGLSAIVGAFLAGAALEGLKLEQSKSLKEGAEYLHMIFGAVFFISLGILTNFRELTVSALPFFLVFLTVAVLTKAAGCGIAGKIVGFTNHESFVIGFGMVPRGEVAMIIALIGLTTKAISQEIYISIVLMSILTTIITPVALRRLKWSK